MIVTEQHIDVQPVCTVREAAPHAISQMLNSNAQSSSPSRKSGHLATEDRGTHPTSPSGRPTRTHRLNHHLSTVFRMGDR